MRVGVWLSGVACIMMSLASVAQALPEPGLQALRGGPSSHNSISATQEQVSSEVWEAEGLMGMDLLNGIRTIIGVDPNVPADQVPYKPFTGSFTTIKSDGDPKLSTTGYCLTDNACGHWEAYSSPDVPLSQLSCNQFCYIDMHTKRFAKTTKYTVDHPPSSYLCCGWETCG